MMETIGDLRAFLNERSWSCETLAEKVPVSNMTLRRLLARPDSDRIPEKYVSLLNAPFSGHSAEIDDVAIVLSGMQQTRAEVAQTLCDDGGAVRDPRLLLTQVQAKVRQNHVPAKLKSLLKDATTTFNGLGRMGQCLILGACAYFMNPFDLIADPIVGIGFVDDIGILSIVGQKLRSKRQR